MLYLVANLAEGRAVHDPVVNRIQALSGLRLVNAVSLVPAADGVPAGDGENSGSRESAASVGHLVYFESVRWTCTKSSDVVSVADGSGWVGIVAVEVTRIHDVVVGPQCDTVGVSVPTRQYVRTIVCAHLSDAYSVSRDRDTHNLSSRTSYLRAGIHVVHKQNVDDVVSIRPYGDLAVVGECHVIATITPLERVVVVGAQRV